MIKIIPHIFILFVFLFGLHSQSQDTSSKKIFKDKVSSVKLLSMPVAFDCSKYPEADHSPLLDSALIRPTPDRYLVGRIFPDNQNITLVYAIIGDNCYPCIYTYLPNGTPIDTLFISGGCSDIPLGCFTSYSTRINADQTIAVIDSVGSYDLDANDNKISGTESGKVTIRKYELKNTGYFSLLGTSTNKIH